MSRTITDSQVEAAARVIALRMEFAERNWREYEEIARTALEAAAQTEARAIVVPLYDHTPNAEVAEIIRDLQGIGIDDARVEGDWDPPAQPGVPFCVVCGSRVAADLTPLNLSQSRWVCESHGGAV